MKRPPVAVARVHSAWFHVTMRSDGIARLVLLRLGPDRGQLFILQANRLRDERRPIGPTLGTAISGRNAAGRAGAIASTMTLHFAYGSNMSSRLMVARCPQARALGTALLAGWRFVITSDGVGSIAPRAGAVVYGVLWRLTPRDLAAINAYESLDSGLYLRRLLSVRHRDGRAAALVYIARRRGEGRPRPGYINVVVEAAHEWKLPEPYIRSLGRWSPSRLHGARPKESGELG
jgi:hypothetical protein